MAWVAPALTAVGNAAGTAGTAIANTAGTVGTALEGAVPGLSDIVQGIGTASAPSEAGYLASLGQAVPEGVDLVGPSPTFTGPGFMQSFAQGFLGAPNAAKFANPSAGTSIGSGVGQLFNALSQMGGGGGGGPASSQPQTRWQPVVQGVARHLQGPEMAPAATPPSSHPGPIMQLIGDLLQGF